MKDIRNSLKFHLLVCLLLLFIVNTSYATEISLRWQANAEPDLEGYEIYYAPISDGLDSITVEKVVLKLRGVTATQIYDEELSSNTNPHFTLKRLNSSVNYVIALKAYDNEGLVSGFSEKCSRAHGCDGSSGDGDGGRSRCFIWEAIRKDTFFK